tara:strand:+ start:502 stop:1320 length:819 start_codon:yes stop_codon:yes gene_type:complete
MSDADEIKKLKDLLEEGVITEEEYENKKKTLLTGKSKSSKTKWFVGVILIFGLISLLPSSDDSGSSSSSSSSSSTSSSSSSKDWGSCSLSSYGSISSQSLDGYGDNIITWNGNGGIMSFKHTGSGYVGVTTYGINGEYIDLLVNEVGNYSGNHLFGIWSGEDVSEFEIQSDGNWELSLKSVSSGAKKVSGTSKSGKGADVINATSVCEYNKIQISHNGEGYFGVWAISPKSFFPEDLLVNEIGTYSGVVRLPEDFELIVIEADGNWQIDFKK